MSDVATVAAGLEALKAFDRLEVGPVRVERRRLLAPYTVYRQNGSDATVLIYRFEEDVFDVDDPAAQNLAHMMAVQVALNYGLFCDELVFHGLFDRADRQFLLEMARNTAREIYVKKILHSNPFLKDDVKGLSAVKQDHYLRATLTFPGRLAASEKTAGTTWSHDRSKIAVLASGGKESLLSDALLREIGRDVHAVFVNESGKHWFTALNAYRYFAGEFADTARVWTNSDRVFSWMLRRLPFVREDFANLRADFYPIRLWTVAVFLFGALPILRKRGIGRVVIGNEFDTTVRMTHQGIPHYNGLYDQSRYFDHAMTRYFWRKGWRVCQFSILRPFSELLVEKLLVERYPELQRQQVSCHAAHMAQDRVRPCGQCEKCTRVAAMLTALGADPTACGYTPAQIERCLAALPTSAISQELRAQEHLASLLVQKGLLPGGALGPVAARERAEVMKLRFDPERSPMEDIPVDLREPLYRIALEHVGGAVKREGRVWIDLDPLRDPGLIRPYPFEAPDEELPVDGELTTAARSFLLGELTWPQAQRRFKEVDVALLPVGAIEQHGPHLPLDTDAFDAEYLCRAVAERCSDPAPLVLPLLPYGVSYHHDDFRGTISIGPETLAQLAYEIGMGVARHGITKLVIVNGHGGNAPALHFAAQRINRDAHIFTCVDSGETSDADIAAFVETPNDVHAGEVETSTALATRPELVDMRRARRFVPKFSSHYLNFSSKRSVDWYARTARISPTGVLGDPTRADSEKGQKIWKLMINHLLALVEDLKRLSLDEIHQKSGY
jgi:creatinine amidohydrolase/Fe(II)-dependent formamide hydrolase-like protein/7-cyano-7-deazaguanine synthase in queuosine biosynthesis